MEKSKVRDEFDKALDRILEKQRIPNVKREALIEILTMTTIRVLEKEMVFIDRESIGLIEFVNHA